MADVILEWKPQGKKPTLKELENYFIKQIDEELEIEKRDIILLVGKEGTKYIHEFHDPIMGSLKPNKDAKINVIDFMKYTDDYMDYCGGKKPVVIIIMDDQNAGYEAITDSEEIDAFCAFYKKNRMKRAYETALRFLEQRAAAK